MAHLRVSRCPTRDSESPVYESWEDGHLGRQSYASAAVLFYGVQLCHQGLLDRHLIPVRLHANRAIDSSASS